MPEAAPEIGPAAHLPEQPAQGLGPLRRFLSKEYSVAGFQTIHLASGNFGQEGPVEGLREVEEDGARLEDALVVGAGAAVEEGGDLGVGVDVHESARELFVEIKWRCCVALNTGHIGFKITQYKVQINLISSG